MQKFWVVMSEEASTHMLGTPVENSERLDFRTTPKEPVVFHLTSDQALEAARKFYHEDEQYSVIAQVVIDDASIVEALTAVQFGNNVSGLTGKCLEHFWFPARK